MKLLKRNKKLIIIAGAAGEIGTEFCRKVVKEGIDCIGVVRNKKTSIESSFFREVTCDLIDDKQIENSFSIIDFKGYGKIIFLHTIGNDKFDPRGYPSIKPLETIPSDVYDTNVNTFKYLLKYLAKRIHLEENNTQFKIAIIAGAGDKYTPFVIESFCEAKFILKEYIRSYIDIYPEWVSGLSINITSTITKSALKVRPDADTTYWLEPEEVVQRSFEELISFSSKYREIDIIKESPDFTDGYYEDNKILYEKWSKETGIK